MSGFRYEASGVIPGCRVQALVAGAARYTVALRRVVYLKRFSREGRVGFTG